MKGLLLSVLACGMCVSAFAQIDTSKKIGSGNSDKWELIKGVSKTRTGKLFVNLPKGAEWDMTIYDPGTTKVLSNTSLKTNFILQPGSYDLEINHIKIMGVPIEKGSTTRLKAGVLHIENSTAWTLYDSAKQIVLINSLAAETRGLPAGKYKLRMNGDDHNIVIEDGKIDEETDRGIEAVNPSVYEKWEISPINTFIKGKGILNNDFPGVTSIVAGNTAMLINFLHVDLSDHFLNTGPIYLYSGKHRVALNNVVVENVPILDNNETRLKTGILIVRFDEGYDRGNGWTLFDKTRTFAYSINNIYPMTLLLPVGVYSIRYPRVEKWEDVTVRDRETVEVIIKYPQP